MEDEYEASRQCFARYILPYLRKVDLSGQQTRAQELSEFWEAAFLVMLDRFPVMDDPQDALRLKKVKRILQAHAVTYLSLPRYSLVLPSVEEWRTSLTIEADRAKRRQWWKEHGSGPLKEHQFIVAFHGTTS
ncbi:hypothetical protein ONZ45_g10708 [Pleurotus djamor]|nr:hypothetical protein ONZ45_g10708 [Pleurotus djamor]